MKRTRVVLRLLTPLARAGTICCNQRIRLADYIDHLCDCHGVNVWTIWIEDNTGSVARQEQ